MVVCWNGVAERNCAYGLVYGFNVERTGELYRVDDAFRRKLDVLRCNRTVGPTDKPVIVLVARWLERVQCTYANARMPEEGKEEGKAQVPMPTRYEL